MGIDLSEIGRLLGPGDHMLWAVFLYLIFGFGLLTLILIPDKNLIATLVTASVLLFALIAKLSLAAPNPILETREFGFLIINAWMGIMPFMVAGMMRTRKRSNPALVPALITGFIGTGYFFAFWALMQRA